MIVRFLFIQIILVIFTGTANSQVRIRIFADKPTASAVFTPVSGTFKLDTYKGETRNIQSGEPVILERYDGRIAVKIRNSRSFICDSLIFTGLNENCDFYLRNSGTPAVKQKYSGDLQCLPDLGKIIFINICDIEKYIAGVVKAEGGSGRYIEYIKTQALLARTYMYKYFHRHGLDRYNLCDNTHCQAFNGIASDSLILKAALETRGLVVLDNNNILINSAFHSNCGGETCSSGDVWLSDYPYLRKVVDPYCVGTRNAVWTKNIPLSEWVAYLVSAGYAITGNDPSIYNFTQLTRQKDYRTGSFVIPFSRIRSDLNLRSAFFSVMARDNMVILKGRGYGHGVGLCQEGAMVMAAKGLKYTDIIKFYFTGVIIDNVNNSKTVNAF